MKIKSVGVVQSGQSCLCEESCPRPVRVRDMGMLRSCASLIAAAAAISCIGIFFGIDSRVAADQIEPGTCINHSAVSPCSRPGSEYDSSRTCGIVGGVPLRCPDELITPEDFCEGVYGVQPGQSGRLATWSYQVRCQYNQYYCDNGLCRFLQPVSQWVICERSQGDPCTGQGSGGGGESAEPLDP